MDPQTVVPLNEHLLPGAPEKPLDSQEAAERKGLIYSFLALVLSIPALIGA